MQINAKDWSNARCSAEQLAERLGCCLIGVHLNVLEGHNRWKATLLIGDEEKEVDLASERGGR